MRWRRRKHDDTETAIANFAYTFAKAMLVCCLAMFAMISEDKTDDGIRPKVEAVFMIDWQGDLNVDVDLLVKTPEGVLVYYAHKESGQVFLDRDDLGGRCNRECSEIASWRGLPPGEYVVNLLLYAAGYAPSRQPGSPLRAPVNVHAKLIKLNPKVVLHFEKDFLLTSVKEEQHMVRFRITPDGEIDRIETDRPTRLIKGPGE